MRKNRSEKEVSKLRAEIEILKARLKETGYSSTIRVQADIQKTNVPVQPNVPANTQKEKGFELTDTKHIKADLSRTFLLTIASFSFILILKYAVLPNEKAITENSTKILNSINTTFNKGKK